MFIDYGKNIKVSSLSSKLRSLKIIKSKVKKQTIIGLTMFDSSSNHKPIKFIKLSYDENVKVSLWINKNATIYLDLKQI